MPATPKSLIDIRPDHWAIVRRILQKHAPQYEVWAFGSRAKWTAKEYSDLDLAVISEQTLSLSVSAALADDFSQSDLPFKVDVVDWASTGASFRELIRQDRVVVQEAQSLGKGGMADEWRETTLDQLGRIVTGKTPPSSRPEYFGGDVPFVTPTDFDGRRLIESTGRYLTEEGANSVSGSRVPAGAVMVSCIGSDMGKAALATQDCVTNQQINSIVVDPANVPLFVYYNLSTRKSEIRSLAGGSAQPILNKTAFGRLDIVLPPADEQRTIAYVLGTLDDKIELNRRMNETLEKIAQTLFKSWFVDFDPVRAKAEARDPGLPKSLADLFPDSFEDSELGEIPKGWQVHGLDELARFLNGLALQKYPAGDGESLPIIKIAQLRAGHTSGADRASLELPPDYVVEDGDVLFSWSGSLECVLWAGGRGALNQHLFKVTSGEFPKWLFYLWIGQHLEDFRRTAAAKATTMGHIQRHHLSEAKVVIPPKDLLTAADQHFGPLIDAIPKLLVQSRSLGVLRDELLPKLVSGKVRIENAAAFLGGGS